MRFLFSALIGCSFLSQAKAQISLGSASSFSVLAASTITNTGDSIITNDIGVSPGTAITGFPPGIITDGVQHVADAAAQAAQADALAAYNALAAEPRTATLTGQDLGGLTLTPGTYFFANSAQLTGALVLDAAGDPNAQFIFQIGSTLTTASASRVTLVNGANACNVFWQVGSSATIGTTSAFNGNVLASASITMLNSATDSSGGLYALNGAVTLDTNTVGEGGCISASITGTTTAPTSTSTEVSTVTFTTTTSLIITETSSALVTLTSTTGIVFTETLSTILVVTTVTGITVTETVPIVTRTTTNGIVLTETLTVIVTSTSTSDLVLTQTSFDIITLTSMTGILVTETSLALATITRTTELVITQTSLATIVPTTLIVTSNGIPTTVVSQVTLTVTERPSAIITPITQIITTDGILTTVVSLITITLTDNPTGSDTPATQSITTITTVLTEIRPVSTEFVSGRLTTIFATESFTTTLISTLFLSSLTSIEDTTTAVPSQSLSTIDSITSLSTDLTSRDGTTVSQSESLSTSTGPGTSVTTITIPRDSTTLSQSDSLTTSTGPGTSVTTITIPGDFTSTLPEGSTVTRPGDFTSRSQTTDFVSSDASRSSTVSVDTSTGTTPESRQITTTRILTTESMNRESSITSTATRPGESDTTITISVSTPGTYTTLDRTITVSTPGINTITYGTPESSASQQGGFCDCLCTTTIFPLSCPSAAHDRVTVTETSTVYATKPTASAGSSGGEVSPVQFTGGAVSSLLIRHNMSGWAGLIGSWFWAFCLGFAIML